MEGRGSLKGVRKVCLVMSLPHSRASDVLGTENFRTVVTVLSLYEVVMGVPISHMGRAGPQRHLSLAQVRIIKSAGRWDARSIPIK